MVLPVPEVMFKVIALGLEGVVILVFDLPSSAPSRDKGFNSVIRNQVVGRESILVEEFTQIGRASCRERV